MVGNTAVDERLLKYLRNRMMRAVLIGVGMGKYGRIL